MKKNLIALAVFGAFSGAALAQSNVTLYGIVDVGYTYSDPSGNNLSSTKGINGGTQSGNRWGIRGAEALSPNLNAVFTLEGGFSIDTGVLGQNTTACTTVGATASTPCAGALQNRLFGRQVWGGLSGGWGTVVAGRIPTFSSGTGSFDMIGAVDPFGTGFAGGGGMLFSSAGGNGTPLRLDNVALYQSPNFGGFKFGVGYSFNASGAELAGSGNNLDVWFAGASYAAGPFYAAVTYDSFDIPGAGTDQKNLQIGATFDLKFLKLHGAYAKEDDQRVFNVVGLTNGADADAWMVGVSVPLFGGSLFTSYNQYDGDAVATTTTAGTPGPVDERDAKMWAIGYSYPLSRRTNLYFDYGKTNGDRTLSNSLSFDRSFYAVGLRHLF